MLASGCSILEMGMDFGRWIWILDAGFWMLDFGDGGVLWMLDRDAGPGVGDRELGASGVGGHVALPWLDTGFWTLDSGCQILGRGVDSGCWTGMLDWEQLGSGSWGQLEVGST